MVEKEEKKEKRNNRLSWLKLSLKNQMPKKDAEQQNRQPIGNLMRLAKNPQQANSNPHNSTQQTNENQNDRDSTRKLVRERARAPVVMIFSVHPRNGICISVSLLVIVSNLNLDLPSPPISVHLWIQIHCHRLHPIDLASVMLLSSFWFRFRLLWFAFLHQPVRFFVKLRCSLDIIWPRSKIIIQPRWSRQNSFQQRFLLRPLQRNQNESDFI